MKTPLKINFPGNVIADASGETVAALAPGHPEFAEYRELFKFAPELKATLEEIVTLTSADAEGLSKEEVIDKVALRARRALAIIIPNAPGPRKADPETFVKLSNS